jgi:diguanylate cyclase (GGDEF)-like protein/PAS domain S-box-containing protein
MQVAQHPANEAERLDALKSYGVLDTVPEPAFDNIVRLASKLTSTPICVISFIDAERQWFKAKIGIEIFETPRDIAFCSHTILEPSRLTIVSDACADPRFRNNPLVTGAPHIRFYAAAPLVTAQGAAIGSLCVIDLRPREISMEQQSDLLNLAGSALTALELRRSMTRMHNLAMHDGLTGLVNRNGLICAIDSAITTQRIGGVPFGLIYLDLDGFKQINDNHGHGAGDQVLRKIALMLTAGLDHRNLACRVGGDEFAIVVGTSEQETHALAERIRIEVEGSMYASGWPVTVSVGAAWFSSLPDSAEATLNLADALMYRAKAAGKNRTAFESGNSLATEIKQSQDWRLCLVQRDHSGNQEIAARDLELSNDGLLIADLQITDVPIIYVNRSFERITGFSSAETLGKNCRYLQGGDHLQPEIKRIHEAINARRSVSVTLRNYRKDGSMFWNNLTLSPLLDVKGVATHYIGQMRDVTESQKALDLLNADARLDRLTQSLTRYRFMDKLAEMMLEGDRRILLAKIDIAGLRDINSGFGFEVGDQLIIQTVLRLDALGGAIRGRFADNKFAIAFHLEENQDPSSIVTEIEKALSIKFTLPAVALAVRFAIGYVIGEPGGNAELLARNAASALHESKKMTFKGARRYDHASDFEAGQKLRLTAELHQAVLDDDFVYFFQPQVDMKTGALVGAEALIRWQHRIFGLQQPNAFIHTAENSGLIVPMSVRGLRRVAHYAMRINQDRSSALTFSYNISPLELMHGDLVLRVHEVVAETGINPAWLTLELTEGILTEDSDQIRSVFRELRSIGVGLSIDDFGTGNSSLRYLESFPISEIKIDRSFVHDVSNNGAKRIIAETVISLGKYLAATVVAEGIETEDERTCLLSMDCPVGQGYLFNHPLSEDEFTKLAGESTSP